MCWETVAAAAAAGAALPEGKNELPGSLQIPYTTYTQQDFLHNRDINSSQSATLSKPPFTPLSLPLPSIKFII